MISSKKLASVAAYSRRVKADPVRYAAYREKRRTYTKERSRQRKIEAIEYKGGYCSRCAGVFHPAAYDFHHRNPSEKEFDPCKMLLAAWEKLTAELDKCDLLCSNCHRIVHYQQEEHDVPF